MGRKRRKGGGGARGSSHLQEGRVHQLQQRSGKQLLCDRERRRVGLEDRHDEAQRQRQDLQVGIGQVRPHLGQDHRVLRCAQHDRVPESQRPRPNSRGRCARWGHQPTPL